MIRRIFLATGVAAFIACGLIYLANSQQGAVQASQSPAPPPRALTEAEKKRSSELIQKADKLFEAYYAAKADTKKKTPTKVQIEQVRGEIDTFRKNIDGADTGALVVAANRMKQVIDLIDAPEIERAALQATTASRKSYAYNFERRMLSAGFDAHIEVSEAYSTTITIRYVLMSRPVIYKLTEEGDFLDQLRKLGFKKAIFTDGYDLTWKYFL